MNQPNVPKNILSKTFQATCIKLLLKSCPKTPSGLKGILMYISTKKFRFEDTVEQHAEYNDVKNLSFATAPNNWSWSA